MIGDDESQSSAARPVLAQFQVREQAGVRTVAVRGELDASNVDSLQRTLHELANDALGVVLDLRATDYLDSAAVQLLYGVRRRLARRGQALAIISRAHSNVERVLELTAFLGEHEPRPRTAAQAARAIRGSLAARPEA